MPHLVLEYSGNTRDLFDFAAVFTRLHTELAAVAGYRVQDFKSRAVRMDTYAIGAGDHEQSFVNLDVRTFAGKSQELKATIGQAALGVLAEAFPRTLRETACDISVQITELDRSAYARTRSEDRPGTATVA